MSTPAYTVKSSFNEGILMSLLDNPIINDRNISAGADVVGLTLEFTVPLVTVTFTGTDPLTAKDIVSQINAAVAGSAKLVKYDNRGNQLQEERILLSRGVTGLTLGNTGTATGILGFPTGAATVQAAVHSARFTTPFLLRQSKKWILFNDYCTHLVPL